MYSLDLTYSKAPDANIGKRCLSIIFTHNAILRKTRKPYKYRNSLGESAEAVLLLLSKAIVSFSHLLRQGKKNDHPIGWKLLCVGIFLSSRAVTSQVFSALMSLTSVFGMGTGGPPTSSTPTIQFVVSLEATCLLYTVFR